MTNVALITIDSLRADHVGYHGYNRNTTPFLDSLSGESIIYNNAFSHGCSTRIAFPPILGSDYALQDDYQGVWNADLMLAEVLNNNDVDTAAFHSNVYLKGDFGYDRGFEIFEDFTDESGIIDEVANMAHENLSTNGHLRKYLRRLRSLFENVGNKQLAVPYTRADTLSEKVINYIQQTTPDDNFLWAHYMDVHSPFLPPNDSQEEVLGTNIESDVVSHIRNNFPNNREALSEQDIQSAIDLYDSEIRFVDGQIESLVYELKNSWEDPLIIITSDHGEEFLDHGNIGHQQTLYDELVHVPLIIHGSRYCESVDKQVALSDIPATILEYFGTCNENPFIGENLLDSTTEERQSLIIEGINPETQHPYVGYRIPSHKFINKNENYEFYDLNQDPGETNNIISNSSDRRFKEEAKRNISEHLGLINSSNEVRNVDLNTDTEERLKQLGYIND